MSHDEIHYLEHDHEQPDAWHRHGVEEGMPQHEHTSHVNTAALALVLFSIAAFVLVTVGVTVVFYRRYVTDIRQDRLETTELATQQLEYRGTTLGAQDQYSWVDTKAGTVRIPVSAAMERVVRSYTQGDGEGG